MFSPQARTVASATAIWIKANWPAVASRILALVAMRLFHGKELPYYRNAGLGEDVLAAGSWAMALLVGGVLLVAGMMWT